MPKQRNVALCIVLSIITCGIYGLYWYACLANDINTVTKRSNMGGGMVLLLTIITCNIYGLVFAYSAGDYLDKLRMQSGHPTGNLGLIYLLLSIFGLDLVAWALMQHELNEYIAQ